MNKKAKETYYRKHGIWARINSPYVLSFEEMRIRLHGNIKTLVDESAQYLNLDELFTIK